MSALDDRLRSAADAVHQQMEHLSVPEPVNQRQSAARPSQKTPRVALLDTAGARRAATGHRARPSRALVALAAAVVVVLGASAVVGVARRGSHRGSALNIALLAATTQRQSVRMRITATRPMTLELFPHPTKPPTYRISGETGVYDFQRHVARIEIQHGSGNNTELVVGTHAYISLDPEIAANLPTRLRNKRWFEMNNSTDASAPLPFDLLAQLRQDPGTTSIQDLGTTQIGAEKVHHYKATGPKTPGVSPILIADIYVDSNNRLVRLRYVMNFGAGAAGAIQMDFSDYGVPVNVTAPPADEVVPVTDLPLVESAIANHIH